MHFYCAARRVDSVELSSFSALLLITTSRIIISSSGFSSVTAVALPRDSYTVVQRCPFLASMRSSICISIFQTLFFLTNNDRRNNCRIIIAPAGFWPLPARVILWVILAATKTRRGIAYVRIREEDCGAHICKVISRRVSFITVISLFR